ncbi:MAG: FAD-dependent oxidoreductase [Rhodospirillales bacterium]|nr:FAD-dependent oxidoreductase [Rhodospirillales bacterium]
MMAGRTPEVLVVGLGPAGSRAAAAAAEAGRSVVAVDRRRAAGHPVQCAEFVPAMIGQELRALDSVIRQRIRAMATFVEDRPPDLWDNFPGHMIDRAAFDRSLVEAARQADATAGSARRSKASPGTERRGSPTAARSGRG